MTLTTLVSGGNAATREAAIAAAIDPNASTAILIEGLPDGKTDPLAAWSTLQITRIAPGCICCSGNLTMRVTLNRILRRPPQRLFISLASDAHCDRIHAFLTQPPYDILLTFTKDLCV